MLKRPYKFRASLTKEGGELLEALIKAKRVDRSSVLELAISSLASTSRIKIKE